MKIKKNNYKFIIIIENYYFLRDSKEIKLLIMPDSIKILLVFFLISN